MPGRVARRERGLLVTVVALSGCSLGGVAVIGRDEKQSEAARCAPACSQTQAGCGVDYCTSVPALVTAPTIDGVLECGLSLASFDPTGWNGNLEKPAEVAVAYAVAWRPDGVYVFVEVRQKQRLPAPTDAAVYCGDAAHVFVDDDGTFLVTSAYDLPGTRQLVAAAPVDAQTPGARGERYVPSQPATPWRSTGFRTFPTADGYVLEALITGEDLGRAGWSLESGRRIGFDLSIGYGGLPSLYDDARCPKRSDFVLRRSAASADTTGYPHTDTRAFCTPSLSAPASNRPGE